MKVSPPQARLGWASFRRVLERVGFALLRAFKQLSRHLADRSQLSVRCTSNVRPAGFHIVDIGAAIRGRSEVLTTPH
jgi:hypothetical protein